MVFEHPRVDLWSAAYSRQRKVLTHAEFMEDKIGRQVFDAADAGASCYERLQKRLPGYELTLQSGTLRWKTSSSLRP